MKLSRLGAEIWLIKTTTSQDRNVVNLLVLLNIEILHFSLLLDLLYTFPALNSYIGIPLKHLCTIYRYKNPFLYILLWK